MSRSELCSKLRNFRPGQFEILNKELLSDFHFNINAFHSAYIEYDGSFSGNYVNETLNKVYKLCFYFRYTSDSSYDACYNYHYKDIKVFFDPIERVIQESLESLQGKVTKPLNTMKQPRATDIMFYILLWTENGNFMDDSIKLAPFKPYLASTKYALLCGCAPTVFPRAACWNCCYEVNSGVKRFD